MFYSLFWRDIILEASFILLIHHISHILLETYKFIALIVPIRLISIFHTRDMGHLVSRAASPVAFLVTLHLTL